MTRGGWRDLGWIQPNRFTVAGIEVDPTFPEDVIEIRSASAEPDAATAQRLVAKRITLADSAVQALASDATSLAQCWRCEPVHVVTDLYDGPIGSRRLLAEMDGVDEAFLRDWFGPPRARYAVTRIDGTTYETHSRDVLYRPDTRLVQDRHSGSTYVVMPEPPGAPADPVPPGGIELPSPRR